LLMTATATQQQRFVCGSAKIARLRWIFESRVESQMAGNRNPKTKRARFVVLPRRLVKKTLHTFVVRADPLLLRSRPWNCAQSHR